jgi:Fe-S oxidoreductase
VEVAGREYDEDRCEQCGECLVFCPVMHLPPARAKREISKLRSGERSVALKKCTTCLDCEFTCRNGCAPGALIQSRFSETVSRRGLPERARYFMPHSHKNFRTYVMDRASSQEKDLVRSFADMTPAEEVCYPGCNMIVTPLLTQGKALEGLDIRGSLDVCCGEMYFRMGMFDQVRQVAKKTQAYFDELEARKVTILCTAGYYIFTRVLPEFGADFSFEMEPYLSLVKRRLDSGELKFTTPLNMTVTVQDSCYGKQFGEEYTDLPREILSRAGAEVVEMENSGECMLCCGIGGGFSPYSAYNPFRLVPSMLRTMRVAKKSGAGAVVTYCSGCLQMFSTGAVLYPNALPTYHLLELVELALGGSPKPFHESLGRNMLAGVLLNQTPALLKPGRFMPDDIT